MNCIENFVSFALKNPEKPALYVDGSLITFGELLKQAGSIQQQLKDWGIKSGDGVLLFDTFSSRLYASIIAILGMGAHVVFVEPWMPLSLLNKAVAMVKPKLFLTRFIGRLWGWRAKSIRQIPLWKSISSIPIDPKATLSVEKLAAETTGVVTFTTGTTGAPKGVVRTHQFLLEQHHAISRTLKSDLFTGPDLCIFANFALTNLASGRCSILVSKKWNRKLFQSLEKLPTELLPVTLTCGPAFLKQLIQHHPQLPLKSIHIGGALTDCCLFEEGFAKWPEARWVHVYGSSEAEPVASADARQAVELSKKRGYFQTLFVGQHIPEIEAKVKNGTLWVTGPHVSTFYLGDAESNLKYKEEDIAGKVWHDMGDRILMDQEGWWFGGRGGQPIEEFILEQKIYTFLNSSNCFIYKNNDNSIYLFGEDIKNRQLDIKVHFPEIKDVYNLTVYRDHRHRARIDRKKSLQKGAPWIVG